MESPSDVASTYNSMRLVSVVGARPNFMKVAAVLAELRGMPGIEHCLVHTGQHYDEKLSRNFFGELGLPEPDINLQVGSGSHTWQTAEVMKRLEPVFEQLRPALVIVVGDVNSTLAAALTAAKLGLRLAHIEAGLRSFDSTMPEEINRKVTDVLADLLFVSEESGVTNLKAEGIPVERIFFVGNVMIDTLLRHRDVAARSSILRSLGLKRGNSVQPYAVLTLHRPSNVDQEKALKGLLTAAIQVARHLPVLFPIHPRTLARIQELGLQDFLSGTSDTGLRPLEPLGYLDFLCLMDHARLVFTDSGGIQEETTVLGVPCLTLRENTERPATVKQGTNRVIGTAPNHIVECARSVLREPPAASRQPPLWDGKAAQRIVEIIAEKILGAASLTYIR